MNERRTSTESSPATPAFSGDAATSWPQLGRPKPEQSNSTWRRSAAAPLVLAMGLVTAVATGFTSTEAAAAKADAKSQTGGDARADRQVDLDGNEVGNGLENAEADVSGQGGPLLDARQVYSQNDYHHVPRENRHGLNHVDVAISSGYGFGRSVHPDFKERNLTGVMVNLDIALVFHEKVAAGLFVSFLEMPVVRTADGGYEKTGSLNPQLAAEALSFRTGDANGSGRDGRGGKIVAPSVHNFLAGARVEFTPRGQSGLYIGVAAGMGRVDVSAARFGGALDVRGGYRQFLGNALGLSLGIGVQGQLGANTQSVLPYANAELRFRFRSDPDNFKSWRSEAQQH